jgi:hypothetical protein
VLHENTAKSSIHRSTRPPEEKSKTADYEQDDNGLFVQIPCPLLRDPHLLPAAKLLYGRLKLHAGKNGICNPSHGRLAKEISVSEKHIRNLLTQLRKNGYIDWRRTKRDTCRYVIFERNWSSTHDHQERNWSSGQEHEERNCGSAKNGTGVPRRTELEFRQKEALKDELIDSSTTTQTDVTSRPPETPSRGVVADSLFHERLKQARPHFERLEERLGPISGKTRRDLQHTVEAQGFSIAQLAYTFGLYGKTYKTVGGLISFAREFTEHAAAIEEWPCLICFGNGTVAAPGSPFCNETLPCKCEEGEKRAKTGNFDGLAEYLKDPANYCRKCHNTGKLPPAWDSVGDFCAHCDRGKELSRNAAREKDSEEHRRQALRECGKCPDCRGEGTYTFREKTLPCYDCKGTGLPAPPPGSCTECWGRGIDVIGKPCVRCARAKAIA